MADILDLHLATPSDREIVVTRVFAAPRAQVFDALTIPALLQIWLSGPAGWSLTTCVIDLRAGGAYRYGWRRPDDAGAPSTMGMGGVYREVARPERLVATELFDVDWTGGEVLVTTDLAERDGATVLTQTLLYASVEARDGALASGMMQGMAETYAKLAALLASTPIAEADGPAITRPEAAS